MPIHNEHTRKISMPHHQSYNEELEDDTPTPRRVPVVKRSPLPPAQQHYPQSSIAPKQESTWTAPARPIPAQRQYHQPPVAQPTWTPPARPMSAQQYQQQQAAVLSQQTTLPLPKPGSSSSVVGAGLAPALEGGDGFSSPRRSSMVGAGLAPALGRGDGFPSPRASRPKERRRPAIPILITLALLTILIAVGGF